MTGICTTCGTAGRCENHHPGGRNAFPEITAPVCLSCHRILSAWQAWRGLARSRTVGPPANVSPEWCELAAGILDILTLTADHDPGSCDHIRGLPEAIARTVRRAYEIPEPWPTATEPGTAGRTIPEPGSEPDRIAALLRIAGSLFDAIGFHSPFADAMRETDPVAVMRASASGSSSPEHANRATHALWLALSLLREPGPAGHGPGLTALLACAESEVTSLWEMTT